MFAEGFHFLRLDFHPGVTHMSKAVASCCSHAGVEGSALFFLRVETRNNRRHWRTRQTTSVKPVKVCEMSGGEAEVQ